jgi:hypothetical protein
MIMPTRFAILLLLLGCLSQQASADNDIEARDRKSVV